MIAMRAAVGPIAAVATIKVASDRSLRWLMFVQDEVRLAPTLPGL
jgi:hypothetical protein